MIRCTHCEESWNLDGECIKVPFSGSFRRTERLYVEGQTDVNEGDVEQGYVDGVEDDILTSEVTDTETVDEDGQDVDYYECPSCGYQSCSIDAIFEVFEPEEEESAVEGLQLVEHGNQRGYFTLAGMKGLGKYVVLGGCHPVESGEFSVYGWCRMGSLTELLHSCEKATEESGARYIIVDTEAGIIAYATPTVLEDQKYLVLVALGASVPGEETPISVEMTEAEEMASMTEEMGV